LPVERLDALPGGEREAVARQMAEEEAGRPFDLSAGPLVRARLLRLAEDDHIVLLTMHHIITDGWSVGVLVREVAALYEAFTEGKESPLPELAVQYADFAAWQRGWLRGEVLERQLDYWRGQLAGTPAVLELPTARPRTSARTNRAAQEPFTLEAEVTEKLQALSRRESATLFMTVLAGWQALLGFYSGQQDVVVGTDIANRTRAEAEPLIGFFVNQLVLRTDLSGDPTFAGLLRRAREVTLGAYAHQEVPFEKVVEALNPERSLSQTPLFQVKLVLQNAPMSQLQLPGLTFSSIGGEGTLARFDLTLTVWNSTNGLGGTLLYNAGLFNAATITRMVGQLITLLHTVAARPDIRLAELMEVLAEGERRYDSAEESELQEVNLGKLKRIRRRAVGGGTRLDEGAGR